MKKRADLLGPTPYPGSTPQAESDRSQEQHSYSDPLRRDYSVDVNIDVKPPEVYNWAMSGTHVSVSNDDHGVQFGAMAWTDFNRPHAYGTVTLHYQWTALWTIIYTNMSIPLVESRLKRYAKEQGWDWGGIQDGRGEPLDTLKTSLNLPLYGQFTNDNLQDLFARRFSSAPGIGEINPGVKDLPRGEYEGQLIRVGARILEWHED